MTVLESRVDADALTLTFVTEFDATPERVWQLWEDPRQLERWWGPPTWPASFPEHEFVPGGRSHYFMTGPDGSQVHGWWRIVAIDEPRRLEFDDGFADAEGRPVEGNPVRGVATLEARDGRTRMTCLMTFADAADLEKLMEMGMREGMGLALGQIDDILAGVHA